MKPFRLARRAKGYRFLEVDEIIRPGDEYNSDICAGRWEFAKRVNQPVLMAHADLYRRKLAPGFKAVKNSVPVVTITIPRSSAKKLFTLAKRHCKHEIEKDGHWDQLSADEWRGFLKALRALEKETLNTK